MKRLFTEGFTVMDIAESLISFDVDRSAPEIRQIIGQDNVEVVGVRDKGAVSGYALCDELTDGRCHDHLHKFDEGSVLACSASYRDVIHALDRSRYCFVRMLGQVIAYVKRADIQKPSVRMWLFGMITIAEMHMVREIELLFPHETWREAISPGRLNKAEALQAERERMNQEVRLLDCLHFVDKNRILMKDPAVREDLGFGSKREAEQAVKAFESLRNNLAHAHDIVTYDWDTIVYVAGRLERIISRIHD
ncbi:MAG: hypothetical protein ACYSTT_24875 [Planctomycetota bacterium]|jgi:hypothetical protein